MGQFSRYDVDPDPRSLSMKEPSFDLGPPFFHCLTWTHNVFNCDRDPQWNRPTSIFKARTLQWRKLPSRGCFPFLIWNQFLAKQTSIELVHLQLSKGNMFYHQPCTFLQIWWCSMGSKIVEARGCRTVVGGSWQAVDSRIVAWAFISDCREELDFSLEWSCNYFHPGCDFAQEIFFGDLL